jgi:hypothetical protein
MPAPKDPQKYKEWKEKVSQSVKKKWQSKEHREKQRRAREPIYQSELWREKQRQAGKRRWQDKEWQQKWLEMIREYWSNPDNRERQRTAKIVQHQDPDSTYNSIEYRENLLQVIQSEEFREKISGRMLELWQDVEFARKVFDGRNYKPSAPEQLMEQLLEDLFPEEYKYVGDGQFIIGGKNPDFININGQKKIIEVYGDYWHADDDPQERIDFFKRYGFDCLVIWESELQEVDSVVEKLVEFHHDK